MSKVPNSAQVKPPASILDLPSVASASQIAKLLTVTPQWLRQLASAGAIPAADRGKYPLVATVRGYIAWLKDEDRRGMKSTADTGLKAARQREVELRIAKEEGRLVEMDEVEAVVASIMTTLRAEIGGVPAAVTRDIGLRASIEKSLNGAFARSQAQFAKASAALRSGRDPLIVNPG